MRECQEEQALGRSKGGFSSKIHAVCDALGNPLRFIVTPGQRNDCTQAIDLLTGIKGEAVLADKGYDTNDMLRALESEGITIVIPPKSNRKHPRQFDQELYKERHKIECLFGFLKHYRRIFSRFEKLKSRFLAFLHFAAAIQWIKSKAQQDLEHFLFIDTLYPAALK